MRITPTDRNEYPNPLINKEITNTNERKRMKTKRQIFLICNQAVPGSSPGGGSRLRAGREMRPAFFVAFPVRETPIQLSDEVIMVVAEFSIRFFSDLQPPGDPSHSDSIDYCRKAGEPRLGSQQAVVAQRLDGREVAVGDPFPGA